MATFEHVVVVHPMRGAGQDRAAVFDTAAGGLVVALADGAGGTSNGELAAEAVIDAARTLTISDGDCAAALARADADVERLRGGQTTAVLLVLDDVGVRGASVGDSEVWLVDPDQRIKRLTQEQIRKPLLGSGARISTFRGALSGDVRLLVASDGLFRFADAAEIARVVVGDDLAAAAERLVGLVRPVVGALRDDVAIVLARRR